MPQPDEPAVTDDAQTDGAIEADRLAISSRPLRMLARLLALLDQHPWLLPLGSFLAGVLSFALIRRGEGMAQLIALTALLGWPWLLIQGRLRPRLLQRFPSRWTPYALQFVTQSIQQELLFFTLPFLIGATQRDFGQWAFTALAALAAMISVLDPVYEKRVAKHAAVSLLFHAYCSFICALVVLPIALKVQIENALPLALGVTAVWTVLGLPATWSHLRTPRARIIGIALLLLTPPSVWMLRAHVPPAGLSVTEALVTQDVDNRTPGAKLQTISAEALKTRGAIAFVAIRAPMGLKQTVYFQWSQNGQVIDRIAADIQGGSRSGWRTYSRKRNFPEEPSGTWHVDLLTPHGQLIERLEFTVAADK
jgi:hypothetical protein